MVRVPEGAKMLWMERMDVGQWSRLTVIRAPAGWEVREEREGVPDRVIRVSDWHRVERSIQLFDLRANRKSLGPHDVRHQVWQSGWRQYVAGTYRSPDTGRREYSGW
jgi:hypothetical protein